MSRRGRWILILSLLLADAAGVLLGLTLAHLLAVRQQAAPAYLWAALLGLPLWLAIFALLRLYDLEIILEDSQEYATVATGCTYGILMLIVASSLARRGDLALTWLFAGWLFSILGVASGRFLLRRVVRSMRRRGHLMASALVVGADEQGRAIARQLRSEVDSGLRVMGFVDDFLPVGTHVQDGLLVVGHPAALPALVAQHNIAELVVVPGAMAWESFHETLERMMAVPGPRVRLSPGYYDLLATTPRVAHRNFVPLIVVDSARLSGLDALLKAGLDYGAGLLLLIVALPTWALTAAVLRRRGPIYADCSYLGIGGRVFHARMFRVRPGGRAARMGLDRLPLLAQVLLGRMSLAGPRPIAVEERDKYRRWLPALISVKPGVTGPWAVVPVAALEEQVRASLYYIRNWTIWLDLQILTQTLLVTLRRRWGLLGGTDTPDGPAAQ